MVGGAGGVGSAGVGEKFFGRVSGRAEEREGASSGRTAAPPAA